MAKRAITALLAVVMVAAFTISASAAPTYTLRFNHVLGPNHPYHKWLQVWADRVYERTNGDLQILVFHSSQLGVEEDIIE